MSNNHYEELLAYVNTCSKPSELMITDIKVCDLETPFAATIIKILTNQGIEGYGQVREGGSRVYALMLKRLLLGENPCNIDCIFRRIKQFGGQSHQGGGVSAVEMALWDLAGKAYGVPVWRMLGGQFRNKIRIYCDTDLDGKPDGKRMGEALKNRIETGGYTIVKMDLSTHELLGSVKNAVTCPTGALDDYLDSLNGVYSFYGKTSYDSTLSHEAQLSIYKKKIRI